MDYWRDRAEELSQYMDVLEDEYNEQLRYYYEQSARELASRVKAYYKRYGLKHGMSPDEVKSRLNKGLKSFDDERYLYYSEVSRLGITDEYYGYLRELSGRGYVAREKEMFLQLWAEINKLRGRQTKLLATSLSDVYRHSYYFSVYSMQTKLGFGVSFNKLNTGLIEKMLKAPWIGNNYSDRIWKDKFLLTQSLQQEMMRGIINGDNPKVVGHRLAKSLDSNKYNAERLARTEMNYFLNDARCDALKSQGAEGYIYDATLDMKTCDDCAGLDGKRFSWAEKQVGVNYPPLHPNTRSTVIPDVNLSDEATRIARGLNGKTYFVPHDMDYKTWYTTHVNKDYEKQYYRRKRAAKAKKYYEP